MPSFNISRFFRGQNTTDEARQYMQRRLAKRNFSPIFFALTQAILDVDYRVHITPRQLPFLDYIVTDQQGVEIRFSMFGAVSPVRVYGNSSVSPSRACMCYDDELHDVYRVMLPTNASSQMTRIYLHQLHQVYRISLHVSRLSLVPAPLFRLSNNRPVAGNFELLGPPTFKMPSMFEDSAEVEFPTGSAIVVDDHPLYPRDALFDAHQNLHHNWRGFDLIDKEVVAVFDGKPRQEDYYYYTFGVIARCPPNLGYSFFHFADPAANYLELKFTIFGELVPQMLLHETVYRHGIPSYNRPEGSQVIYSYSISPAPYANAVMELYYQNQMHVLHKLASTLSEFLHYNTAGASSDPLEAVSEDMHVVGPFVQMPNGTPIVPDNTHPVSYAHTIRNRIASEMNFDPLCNNALALITGSLVLQGTARHATRMRFVADSIVLIGYVPFG
ncbi:hypothetical protein CVT24_011781 [Panaeolus cyanescens]|uniref:Uncharacterized protein n=1 Tax=Panaeolus cyanescens TaxID=181874 RepID=A0A409YNI5_9AGAR|nr:hypothetical protein CVT24_011781 [Panaeolus cyanescens]